MRGEGPSQTDDPLLLVGKTRYKFDFSLSEKESPYYRHGKALAERMTAIPLSDFELERFLSVRIHTAERARMRQGWGLLGRVVNNLTGECSRYVPVNWQQLQQICAQLGDKPADLVSSDLSTGDKFLLRVDYVEAAFDIVRARRKD